MSADPDKCNMVLKEIPAPEDWIYLEAHDYANAFPLVPEEDLQKTFPSMWATGYDAEFPIVLFEGKILDGRNRQRSAIAADREPTFREFVGTRKDALDFAMRANVERRQLTDAQRTMIAGKVEPLYADAAKERQLAAGEHGIKGGRGNKTLEVISPQGLGDDPAPKQRAPQSRDEAAAALNVSPYAVSKAKTLLTAAPDLAEKVIRGEMGVYEATRVKQRREGHGKPPKSNGAKEPDENRKRAAEGCAATNALVAEARRRHSEQPPEAREVTKEEIERFVMARREEEGQELAARYNLEQLYAVILSALKSLRNKDRQTILERLREEFA